MGEPIIAISTSCTVCNGKNDVHEEHCQFHPDRIEQTIRGKIGNHMEIFGDKMRQSGTIGHHQLSALSHALEELIYDIIDDFKEGV